MMYNMHNTTTDVETIKKKKKKIVKKCLTNGSRAHKVQILTLHYDNTPIQFTVIC